MNRRSFILVLTSERGSRRRLWDARRPLSLGNPFQWVLEATPGGVRLRALTAARNRPAAFEGSELSYEAIDAGAEWILPSAKAGVLRVQLRPAQTLAPAYRNSSEGEEFRVTTCSGHWSLRSDELNGRWSGIEDGELAFELVRSGTQVTIEPRKPGLILEGRNRVEVEIPTIVTLEELRGATLHGTRLKWRFHSNSAEASSLASSSQNPPWQDWHPTLGIAGVSLLTLLGLAWLWPRPDANQELVPPQYAKIVMEAEPKPPIKAARGAPRIAATQRKKTARAGSESPGGKTGSKGTVVAAFRSDALRSSASGLLRGGMTKLLTQSEFVMGAEGAMEARTLFRGGSDLISSAPAVGLSPATQVKVAMLGGGGGLGAGAGGGNGSGYGKGEHARVRGQGSSFVRMDDSGSQVEEGLTKDEVGEVIHRHLSEVRYCYESSILRSPSTEGKLVLGFVIGAPGTVKTADVKSSTLGDPRLDDCILRRLLGWRFPRTKGGIDVAVSYPFIFKSLGR